jgi:hypothetical protein
MDGGNVDRIWKQIVSKLAVQQDDKRLLGALLVGAAEIRCFWARVM